MAGGHAAALRGKRARPEVDLRGQSDLLEIDAQCCLRFSIEIVSGKHVQSGAEQRWLGRLV